MIIVKIHGGIGNQMFQYAAARQLALKHKRTLKLDITHYNTMILQNDLPYRSFDLAIFHIDENIATESEIRRYTAYSPSLLKRATKKVMNLIEPHSVVIEPHFHFWPQFLDLHGKLFLNGYWQSEKYFLDCREVIKSDFEIRTTLDDTGREMASKITQSNSVCLNVRRQEFASNKYPNYFVGEDYYYKAIKEVEKTALNPHYFIFSDELNWVKKNLNIQSPHTFVEPGLYGEKFRDCLYLMSLCKHFIIPNSTFAWWAAWLGTFGKESNLVITPRKWLNQATINTGDVIPERWIKL